MVKKVILKEEAKIKRIDTNLKVKKSQTKSELELQVQNLKKTNDTLEESNRKKNELLQSFEGKLNNLEEQIDFLSCREIMISKESKTEADLNPKCFKQTQTSTDLLSRCEEYSFQGSTKNELDWHMTNSHGWCASLLIILLV